MRLLFFGDLAATGFGTVTADLGRALLERGVDVRFVSQNEFAKLPEPFDSRTLDLLSFIQKQANPMSGDVHGGVSVPEFIPDLLAGRSDGLTLANGERWGEWRPDAVLLLGDFYGARLMAMPWLAAFAEVPTYHYVPVEGHDLPPSWNDIWRILTPIAMSRFGQKEIEKVTGRIPPLMYHGVDTDTFRPVSPSNPIRLRDDRIILSSKERCKAFFGIHPAAKFVLRTDRNMPRKGYPALLRIMAKVMDTRPDVVLGLHCRAFDQGGDLFDSISKMPAHVRERVLVPDLGAIPREVLVALYNAADVYVSTSAEGFGLTIAEAIACGVPAVGLDYSAVPEVIGPAGSVVPVGRVLDNEYAHHWALPEEDAFADAVGYLLDHPQRARAMGSEGPRHIARNFTWSAAADVMAGLLEVDTELEAVAV